MYWGLWAGGNKFLKFYTGSFSLCQACWDLRVCYFFPPRNCGTDSAQHVLYVWFFRQKYIYYRYWNTHIDTIAVCSQILLNLYKICYPFILLCKLYSKPKVNIYPYNGASSTKQPEMVIEARNNPQLRILLCTQLQPVLRIRIQSDPVFFGHPDSIRENIGSFIHKNTPVILIFSSYKNV